MPTQLYTLAYPNLSRADHDRIELFRQEHDLPFKDVVAAHFTLVFGQTSLAKDEYVKHVQVVAATVKPIDFVCRYAMLGVDDEDERGYVFLVPDEGFSAISRLHDRLYTGVLERSLRLHIPFIPHITVGTLPTTGAAKALCDEWNAKPFAIEGRLDRITVAGLENGKVSDIEDIRLAARL